MKYLLSLIYSTNNELLQKKIQIGGLRHDEHEISKSIEKKRNVEVAGVNKIYRISLGFQSGLGTQPH